MRAFLVIPIFFFSIFSFSQTTISVKVVDVKNKPIPNANVYISGTYDGVWNNIK